MKMLFPTAVLALIGYTASAQQPHNIKAPGFELRDQYEQMHTLKSYAGKTIVLLASDKDGAEQNRQWGALLQKKYGERIGIVRIADVRKAPFFLKDKIRNDFKKDGIPMLLDWEGSVFKTYGFKNGEANVVLIDKSGSVRSVHSGPPEPESVDRLRREIESVE